METPQALYIRNCFKIKYKCGRHESISPWRKILKWVNWSAAATDLKVQAHRRRVRLTHLGDLRATLDCLAFFDKQCLVVRVRCNESITVFNNHQIAQASRSVTGKYHLTVGSCFNRISGISGDINAFGCGRKALDDLAFCGPSPTDQASIRCTTCTRFSRCWRAGR